MKSHPYTRFITWTAATYIEERRPGTKQSESILIWLRAYGVTAARVDAFLRLSYGHVATMPIAMVMDILELSNSKVRQTLKDEYLLDALLNTWDALADMYGKAGTPADRELVRLRLLGEAGHALIMAQGMTYPGAESLLRKYQTDTELLDLSQIHKGTPGFKRVGILLQEIKRQRKVLPKQPTPGPVSQKQRLIPTAAAQKRTPLPPMDPHSGNTAVAHDEDRIPDLPTRGRCRHNPSDNLNFGMFGNWRDHWDNTLP